MNNIVAFFSKVWSTVELRKKLLFTLGIIFIFRVFAHIPLPGVDIIQLKSLMSSSQFLSLLNVFSGGTLSNFSILAVGINPYITASIIMQLSAIVLPQVKQLQKDGESGREKINQYTRYLSVPLAVGQSVSVLVLLRSSGFLLETAPLTLVAMILSLVAGSLLLTWLGELISEKGIGNGISLILFAGIVSQLPQSSAQFFAVSSNSSQFFVVISALFAVLAIIAMIVFMNEAVRKIVIQYAKRTRGDKVYGGQTSHLPIKVNIAGVMPIIFAVSIMLIPSFLARLLISSSRPELIGIGNTITAYFNEATLLYIGVYFITVFLFTFFSALIFFNSADISEELKKSGAFIPGIRPGGATKKYLDFVVLRVTLCGAVFLGFIAILPSIAQQFTGISQLAVGGTSLLIVVSVVLETYKQVEGMLVEQNYDKYL